MSKLICVLVLIFSLSLHCAEFPKILHFIWFGGVPYSEDEAKVKKWISANPDYEINIYYSSFDLRQREEMGKIRVNGNQNFMNGDHGKNVSAHDVINHFNRAFQGNHVRIRPIEDFWVELRAEPSNPILGDDIKNHLIELFYEELTFHELTPSCVNLAAASDIARVLLLYFFGGVYLDFDVSSESDYKIEIKPSLAGFRMNACLIDGCIDYVATDLLASVFHGSCISMVAMRISRNYIDIKNESSNPEYDDVAIENLYKELCTEVNNNEDRWVSVANFAAERNINYANITPLQRKKFADVCCKVGSSLICNEKKRHTAELSGPGVYLLLSFVDPAEILGPLPQDEITLELVNSVRQSMIFPKGYLAAGASARGSWSY